MLGIWNCPPNQKITQTSLPHPMKCCTLGGCTVNNDGRRWGLLTLVYVMVLGWQSCLADDDDVTMIRQWWWRRWTSTIGHLVPNKEPFSCQYCFRSHVFFVVLSFSFFHFCPCFYSLSFRTIRVQSLLSDGGKTVWLVAVMMMERGHFSLPGLGW